MARHFAESGLRPLLTGAQSKVIEFPAPFNGRLTQLLVRIASANAAGDTTFDVNINDVSVYATPADRAKILAGATTGTSVINKEVSLNDMITVDLDAAPLGGISGLYVIVQLDDSPTVDEYIKNIYQWAYLRAPTSLELSTAISSLNAGCGTAAPLTATKTLIDTIFNASEYTTRARSNSDYVEDLYEALLARPSDAGGKAFWVADLVGGATRQNLLDAFNTSWEHINYRVVAWCPHALPLTDAIRLQGKDIASTAPTDGQILQYIASMTAWVPKTLDIISSLFDFKASARAATTGALPSYTASAGALTATVNAALPAQDGVTLVATNRLLVKNESGGNQKYNGLYVVTQIGDGTHPFILTRSDDANTSAKVTANMLVPIAEGTTLKDTQWWLTTNDPIVLDTDALTFAQFGKPSDPNITYFWQSETPPQTGIHKRSYAERNGTIVEVRPYCSLGDGTVAATFDVLKNGVSIYPSATKPSVSAGQFSNGGFPPDTTSFVDGDYFQINVTNTGNCIGPLRIAIIFKGA
jgi:hypothetical protein